MIAGLTWSFFTWSLPLVVLWKSPLVFSLRSAWLLLVKKSWIGITKLTLAPGGSDRVLFQVVLGDMGF